MQENNIEDSNKNKNVNNVQFMAKKFEFEYRSPRPSKASVQNNGSISQKTLSSEIKKSSKISVRHSSRQDDIESENSDVDAVIVETCSKPEHISKECINYITNVDNCLKNLTLFKGALEKEFKDDSNIMTMLSKVFYCVPSLTGVYNFIIDTISVTRQKNQTFYLYEILLNPAVSQHLKMYNPFLEKYATNAKLIGNFSRENQKFVEICEKTKTKHGIPANVNIDNCLYTVFNSLFSMELMFDRYRKCFIESSPQHKKGLEAKMIISNLLSTINTGNDQMKFHETQKELNLLSGRSEKAHINTTFIYKGTVTKYARRDDKHLTRQLVLFTDCLYVTYLPSSISGTSRVRHELSTDSMEISEIRESNIKDVSTMKWGININAKEVVQDFCFDSEETMKLWMEKLQSVIKSGGGANKPPITNRMSTINETSNDSLFWIGTKAPRWQIDTATSFCNGYSCTQKFNTTVRRHHCRSDGLLYCDVCCNNKIKLSFERSDESRVCKLCFEILFSRKNNARQLEESKKQLVAVFEKINHTGKQCGWLSVRKFNPSKNGFMAESNYYCVLDSKDAFLSLHEKHEDKFKADGIILLGTEIKVAGEGSNFYKNMSMKQFIIEGSQNLRNDAYLMTSPNKEDCQNWVKCLRNRIMNRINEEVSK